VKYHIDVSSVLRRTVCDLYSNLVTRSTGATVRKAIEEALAGLPEPNVTVIDFSHVTLLDFSCADEVVGKLLDAYQRRLHPQTYFLIRGVHAAHLEAIEAVLERYDLAVIVQDDAGSVHLAGTIDDGARQVGIIRQHGQCGRNRWARNSASRSNVGRGHSTSCPPAGWSSYATTASSYSRRPREHPIQPSTARCWIRLLAPR
jgi:hypothetical protein